MVPNSAAFQRCSPGGSPTAAGTNLEVRPGRALIGRKISGCCDENIKTLLETSEGNKYYCGRTLLREYAGCPVPGRCGGGRGASRPNPEAMGIACRIKRETMTRVFNKPRKRFKNSGSQKHGRGRREELKGTEDITNACLKENPDTGVLEKAPPPLAGLKEEE
jgi:hypothetical protein